MEGGKVLVGCCAWNWTAGSSNRRLCQPQPIRKLFLIFFLGFAIDCQTHNAQIVYSHPYLVIVSSLSLAYLSTVLFLNLPIPGHYVLPEQQKLTILFQTYSLTWLLLLASTIVLGKLHIGGLYFISAWNAVVLLGGALGCLEGITGAKGFDKETVEEEEADDMDADLVKM